jgi:hypothetical protein
MVYYLFIISTGSSFTNQIKPHFKDHPIRSSSKINMESSQQEVQQPRKTKELSRSIFIESLVGNIKEKYFFEKKIGSGGYGAVYLAKNKQSGRCH